MSHDVLERIDALLPVLRERAAQTEAQRSVPAESIKELQELGFFRLLQPRAWGGHAEDPTVFFDAVRTLSTACGSTGWVASILGVHNWQLALYPLRAQEEVWGSDPHVRMSSSAVPFGTAVKVEGGYRINGRWPFSSGADHADWAMLGSRITLDGEEIDFGTFLVPRADYVIDDVWHSLGLRGTASNTLVVTDVFVPEHRCLSLVMVQAGMLEPQSPEPLYRMPWATLITASVTAPVIGMAAGGYQEFLRQQGTRIRASFGDEQARTDPNVKQSAARAHSEITAGWRLLAGTIAEQYALLTAGAPVPFELRTQYRLDQTAATAHAVAAINRLWLASGPRVLADGDVLQRHWRDINSAAVHASADFSKAATMFADHAFGMEIEPSLV